MTIWPSALRSPRSALQRAMPSTLRADWPGILLWQIKTAGGLPVPERELQFDSTRHWRFDLAWPEPLKIAVEIDGLLFGRGGRHQRVRGFERDLEKLNTAMRDGWMVFRFTGNQVKSGVALRFLESVLKEEDHARSHAEKG